jgi:predicted transcriptional regulator
MTGPASEYTALELINFLSASEYRVETLYAFAENRSLGRHAVRETVDASRSTVRRTLEEFVHRGLIEPTDTGYRITALGELCASGLGDLLETVRTAERFEPLFQWVGPEAFDIDPEWLDDATMTLSTEANPYAPAQRQTETVREASAFEGALPAIELEGAKLVHERITSGSMTAQLVVPESVLETIRSEPFADLFREKFATGRFELFVSSEPLPFYLGLPEEHRIEIGGADGDGIPRVLVQSTHQDFRRWGERRFEEFQTDATAVEASDF